MDFEVKIPKVKAHILKIVFTRALKDNVLVEKLQVKLPAGKLLTYDYLENNGKVLIKLLKYTYKRYTYFNGSDRGYSERMKHLLVAILGIDKHLSENNYYSEEITVDEYTYSSLLAMCKTLKEVSVNNIFDCEGADFE